MTSAPVIIFLGQIGSGKTVQAERLAGALKADHFSVGSLIRQKHIDDQRVHQGELLPDDLVNQVVAEEITEVNKETAIIVDGFPRRLSQKEWFDDFLRTQNRDDIKVVYLQVDDTEINSRLNARGRADDTREAIEKRKRIFSQEVAPVIEAYSRDGLVHEVNGVGDIEDIQQLIQQELSL